MSQPISTIVRPAELSPAIGTGSTALALTNLELPQNFPVVVTPEIAAKVTPRLEHFQLMALAPAAIAKLGFEAELALTKVLDGFLSTVNRHESPAIFGLMDRLNGAVEEQKLDELAQRIIDGSPPPLRDKIIGFFSASALRKAMNKALAETSRIVTQKSQKLIDVVNGLQDETVTEMRKLEVEMAALDNVLKEYTRCHHLFAVETIYLHNAVMVARIQVEELLAGPVDQLTRSQATQKLQALESRALAVEGAMTSLPADQLTLAILQDAGLSTLQEMATTMTVRFSSIKMNLIGLHGAHRVMEVQHLAQKGKDLNDNLAKSRAKVMHQVVTTAATAAGDNRLAQAQQVTDVVNNAKELSNLMTQARVSNNQKFAMSRDILSSARQAMLPLAHEVAANRFPSA